MTQNSTEIIKLFKSRINILELQKKRGFNTESYEGFNLSEVNTMNSLEQIDMLLSGINDDRKVYIKYQFRKKLTLSIINEIIDDLFIIDEILDKKKDDLIIIIKDEPNDSLIKNLKTIWENQNIFITVFCYDRLQFNILNHNLVPEHKVLNNEEKKAIEKKYNITDDLQFPDISRFSPPACAIGLRPGQLCEITRNSKTSITSKFYRICTS
jgi:DNA-directed RNA polymerase subunit H (RpoH/RPB5)